MAQTPDLRTILRRKQVEAETGYSRSTIYLRIAQRLWPRPVSLGPRAVGWPASEVIALNSARISCKSDHVASEGSRVASAFSGNCIIRINQMSVGNYNSRAWAKPAQGGGLGLKGTVLESARTRRALESMVSILQVP